MVYGIGIDIIEIERIQQSCERFGDRFLNRIFTQLELDYSLSKKNKYQHLAARFAAKEAISKALATGWAEGFSWKDIEIYNENSGAPKVRLLGSLKGLLADDKLLKITMSHSHHYVTSFAILHSNDEKI